MRVIAFKDEAEKQEVPIKFEEALSSGNAALIFSPDKAEAIYFDSQELQDLIAELSSGKISLDYLAAYLKLSCLQLHYIVEYLKETGRVSGELTYSTFTSSGSVKLLHLEKMKAQKRMHRQRMREKRK